MLFLQVRRALDFSVLINVGNDFAALFRRVAELHQCLRHSVVDNLDEPAANELLVFHQCEVRLDARGVAIHHEADGARGSEHGYLRILETEFFTVMQRGVPGFLGRQEDRKSTRLNSSHVSISYAVFCLKKKKIKLKYILFETNFGTSQ